MSASMSVSVYACAQGLCAHVCISAWCIVASDAAVMLMSDGKHQQHVVCMQVAVQEVRRLQKYGVTSGELERYKAALIRDSEHVAEQWESVPSVDTLDYCMECLALNHTFMAQEDVRSACTLSNHPFSGSFQPLTNCFCQSASGYRAFACDA